MKDVLFMEDVFDDEGEYIEGVFNDLIWIFEPARLQKWRLYVYPSNEQPPPFAFTDELPHGIKCFCCLFMFGLLLGISCGYACRRRSKVTVVDATPVVVEKESV